MFTLGSCSRVKLSIPSILVGLFLAAGCERSPSTPAPSSPPPSASRPGPAASEDAAPTRSTPVAPSDSAAGADAGGEKAPNTTGEKASDPHAFDPHAGLPPSHPPIGGDTQAPAPAASAASAAAVADGVLSLPGVTFSVPEGWVHKPATSGMGLVAIFSLASIEAEGPPVEVRITHYPNMKGMNDANIDRWLGQVRTPDGGPTPREGAKISERTLGGVTLTIIDALGAVPEGSGMAMDGGPTTKNGRMIAAIVDHERGPHFIKVSGDSATVDRWAESVYAFLNSAK